MRTSGEHQNNQSRKNLNVLPTPNIESHNPPWWVVPQDVGADLQATPSQRLADEYKRPARGCLMILLGVGGPLMLCRLISEVPEVARFMQAHFGR
jgi:hypothetical protein